MLPHDGTLSKYYITYSDSCYVPPDHIDGTMIEPVAIAVQITKAGLVRANHTVVVFGCGPIGLLCEAVCKAYSAKKVIGIGTSPSRLDFARTFGADDVFLPPTNPQGVTTYNDDDGTESSATVAQMIKDQFGVGDGPDIVLEATGAQSCIQTGVHLTKKECMYVQAGMGRENVIFPITITCIRYLTVRGSIRYKAGCYSTAVDLITRGKIDVKRSITNRYQFEDAEKAFELVRQGKESVIKVMIQGVQDT